MIALRGKMSCGWELNGVAGSIPAPASPFRRADVARLRSIAGRAISHFPHSFLRNLTNEVKGATFGF